MTPKQQTIWQWLLPILIIVIFGLVFWGMFANKPEAKSRKQTIKKTTVFATQSKAETSTLTIVSQGEVRPIAAIELRPEVNGRLVFVSDQLVIGGQFKQGDVLAKIDPEPYRLEVVQRGARVAQAEQQYLMAEAESEAAIEELKELRKNDVSELAKGLPQLRQAKAQLDSALADLDAAKLNLSYTKIIAPFDGRVEDEKVSIGQYINRNALVASVYSTEKIEVRLPLTMTQLRQVGVNVDFNRLNDPKAYPVIFKSDFGGQDVTWNGLIARTEAMIDSRTRTIMVVAEMENPYSAPVPLLIGTFVQAEIQGMAEYEFSRLPIKALRNGKDLWLVSDEGVLKIVPAKIVQRSKGEVLVSGLPDQTQVVVSSLPLPSDGLKVRVVDEPGAALKGERVAKKKGKGNRNGDRSRKGKKPDAIKNKRES